MTEGHTRDNLEKPEFVETVTLYLMGLGHVARQVMASTNATDFTASTELTPVGGDEVLDVVVTVKVRK